MPRTLLLLLTALFLATGTALAGLAAQLRPAAIAAPATSAASEQIVRRFYEAVNVAIATGEVTALRAVVAREIIDHARLPGTESGRAELAARLVAHQVTDPQARLVVAELVSAGEQVVAHVEAHPGEELTVAGLPVAGPVSIWPPVEVLRVRGGQVVERWAGSDGTVELGLPHELPLPITPPVRRSLTVARLTLAPGADLDAAVTVMGRALVSEAGVVTVVLDTSAPPSPQTGGRVARDERLALSAGEALSLPEGATYRIRNDGADPAQVLAIAAEAPRLPGGAPPEAPVLPPGVAVEVLAPTVAVRWPADAAVVGLVRLTLRPGAKLALEAGDGPIALAVTAGQLGVASAGQGWVRRAGQTRVAREIEAPLGPGDGALSHDAGPLVLWNADSAPTVVLVVTVRPVAA